MFISLFETFSLCWVFPKSCLEAFYQLIHWTFFRDSRIRFGGILIVCSRRLNIFFGNLVTHAILMIDYKIVLCSCYLQIGALCKKENESQDHFFTALLHQILEKILFTSFSECGSPLPSVVFDWMNLLLQDHPLRKTVQKDCGFTS